MTHAGSPVEDFVIEFSQGLRGPAGWRQRVIAETVDGLTCAAESLARYLGDRCEAERRAVEEWGSAAGLVEEFNRIAATVRARCVARRILVSVPVLALAWAALVLLNPVVWNAGPPAVFVGSHVLWIGLLFALGASGVILIRSRGARASIRSAPLHREMVVACAGLLVAVVATFGLLCYQATVAGGAISWPLAGAPVLLSLLVLGLTGRDAYRFAAGY